MSLLIVSLDQGTYENHDQARDALVAAGFEITKQYSFGMTFVVDGEIEKLSDVDGVSSHEYLEKTCSFNLQELNDDHLRFAVDPTGATDYDPMYTGAGVHIYHIDTGVMEEHAQLDDVIINQLHTRFSNADQSPDFADTHGHGTAVASVMVGSTLGASKDAVLHVVKLFDQTQGEVALSEILAALDSVMSNHTENSPETPKVVCMPWTVEYNEIVNSAVESLIQNGLIVVCAAGNAGVDISTVSPASVLNAITVGAYNRNFEVTAFTNLPWKDGDNTGSGYVNFGAALDIFALGVDVTVAGIGSNDQTIVNSGTSISAGIVAGIMAHYIQHFSDKSSLEIKEIVLAEGRAWGREYLVFEEGAGSNVDYTSVYPSVISTDNRDAVSLTSIPSGRLVNVKMGESAEASLGLNPAAQDFEILDFAMAPPWILVDFEENKVVVDTSDPELVFPGVGTYVFAIRGTVEEETLVEEFYVGVYENDPDDLYAEDNSGYYYDPETGEYDNIVLSFNLGKGTEPLPQF